MRGPRRIVMLALVLLASDAAAGAPRALGAAAPAPVPAVSRRALAVDGDNDAVRVPPDPDLAPPELTVELWLKHRLTRGCGTLIAKDRATGYMLALCDGKLKFATGAGALSGDTIVPEGRWTHVAATFDGITRRVYVNGVLDRESAADSSPVADGGGPMVIGAGTTTGLAFRGTVDNVRVWSLAREGAELSGSASHALGAQPGLVAEWTLDGTLTDGIGGHDGVVPGGAAFTYDGPVPRELGVPPTDAPVVDGRCEPVEYGSAARVAVDAADPPLVMVAATSGSLYVCFDRMVRPRATIPQAFVYVDHGARGRDPIDRYAYRFGIGARGTPEAKVGDEGSGWKDAGPEVTGWHAAQVTDGPYWSVEVRVPRTVADQDLPNGFAGMHLAVGHSSDSPRPGYYLWPVGAAEESPSTWAYAAVTVTAGPPPEVAFRGHVLAEDGSGVPGASVRLLVVQAGAAAMADRATTDGSGAWRVAYRGVTPDYYLVQEVDARATTSVSATADQPASVAGPDLIRYPGDVRGATPGAIFVDRVGPAVLPRVAGLYLIVHAAPVTADDLQSFVQHKQRAGFEVRTTTVEELDRAGGGRDTAERIREWLRQGWSASAADGREAFALLIGRGDRVPFRSIGRPTEGPDGTVRPGWPTDWYYADLDSNWDVDGDGLFGEWLDCPPVAGGRPPAHGRACPRAGAPEREGPYGGSPSPEDDFRPEIRVGRIALSEPGDVRRALAAATAAESSGSPHKRRALVAGAVLRHPGETWDAVVGRAVPGGSVSADPWVGPARDRSDGAADAAVLLDGSVVPALDPVMSEVVRLYDVSIPASCPTCLPPSGRAPNRPLSRAAIEAEWPSGRLGLAVLAAPGTSDGMTVARWTSDFDGDETVDQPAAPWTCQNQVVVPGGRSGPPCDELVPEAFVGSMLPAPAELPPVVFAAAGRTGAVAWGLPVQDAEGVVLAVDVGPHAIAGVLPAGGAASAWVGALGDSPPEQGGAMVLAAVPGLLQGRRLGQAFWDAAATVARANPHDPRAYGLELFGDPAHLYWGNLLEASAVWPQDGGLWASSGSSTRSAPAVPEIAWLARTAAVAPPSIDSAGRLVVAERGGVVRLDSGGSTVDRTSLPGSGGDEARQPAATTGGAYAAAGRRLHALGPDLATVESLMLPPGAEAVGPPRVAPDGRVWVPTDRGMAVVVGSGQSELVVPGMPAGPAAFLPDAGVVWSSGATLQWRQGTDAGGAPAVHEVGPPGATDLTDPAVAQVGTAHTAVVVVGDRGGAVYGVRDRDVVWQTDLGDAVAIRPVIDGDLAVVVTTGGTVAALSTTDGQVAWRRDLAEPIVAAPALDGAQILVAVSSLLIALDRSGGAVLWQVELGFEEDARSIPVVGGDRTVYVARADGAIVAVREAGWLAAPTEVEARAVVGGAEVRWRDGSLAESAFLVEICRPDGRVVTSAVAGPDATFLTVPTPQLAAGAAFAARVRALRAAADAPGARDDGASDTAASSIAAAAAGPPSTPVDVFAAGQTSESIGLSWRYPGNPSELAGFEVRRAPDRRGPYRAVGWVGADARSYVDRGLSPATLHSYEVVARTQLAASAGGRADGLTRSRILPSPADLVGAAGPEGITLSWRDASGGTASVRVERRGPGAADYSTVGILDAGSSSFRDRALIAPGSHHYRVVAFSGADESPPALVRVDVAGESPAPLFLPYGGTDR